MNDAQNQVGFCDLPPELLLYIIRYTKEGNSLLLLSSANRTLRHLCACHIFRKLKIAFLTTGLDRLLQISHSRIALHVREIIYEVTERIDPHNYKYFRSQIYTLTKYQRDQNECFWTLGGKKVLYLGIFHYFSAQAREQHLVQEKAQDTEALITSIPRFKSLEAVEMVFVDGVQSPFHWFAGRVFLDCIHALTKYLVKMTAAMTVAKLDGVTVRIFTISGFYSRLEPADPLLLDWAGHALSHVKELKATNSPIILEFLSRVSLPSLQQFELASCWLSLENLEDFIRKHAAFLCYLHLEDMWLLHEKINKDRIFLSMANAQSIFNSLKVIRDIGILDELTINRRPGGLYEAKARVCSSS
ncbi:hypothetical protein P170DRAFT_358803 [Aspergillus steynii IBT 23096]|uniref:F-box domain-containing protein n=1 Tax=Aspergillus steynii IBT 23096 TaxID=1392250 RepID=A0A2I2G7B1_9EURO|nr:uncharacterized protein P170DRAFT_358803 [Aspergillus steynii IBT 23096]PLB48777.1 hypothetical protein P170DRAFT_358803 [Aspergillus steynii IBT 23096]